MRWFYLVVYFSEPCIGVLGLSGIAYLTLFFKYIFFFCISTPPPSLVDGYWYKRYDASFKRTRNSSSLDIFFMNLLMCSCVKNQATEHLLFMSLGCRSLSGQYNGSSWRKTSLAICSSGGKQWWQGKASIGCRKTKCSCYTRHICCFEYHQHVKYLM